MEKYLVKNDGQYLEQCDFINQLYYEINVQTEIQHNPQIFIQHKKIKIYNFKKNTQYIEEDDLPNDILLGSSYLIKGDNILETYSWCDNEHSLYLQINVKKPMWLGKISIVNIDARDSENLEFLLDGFTKFYTPSNLQYSIINFIQSGFSLYIKDKAFE
jgi:hypothetical protein